MAIDVESAVMRLYEDVSLRDAISDNPANTLLKWAEDKVIALAEKHEDEEAFEEAFSTLRRLIKTMNRYGGRQNDMDGEEKQEQMGKLVERAQSLGFPVKQPKADDMIQAQGVMSEEDGINTLIDMLESSDSDDAINPMQEPPLEEDEETVPIDPYKLGLTPLSRQSDDVPDAPDEDNLT